MSGDRMDDVELRIEELEATVRGLTEELVEANERINQLEERLGEEGTADAEGATDEPNRAEDEGGDEETADDLDDIIVA